MVPKVAILLAATAALALAEQLPPGTPAGAAPSEVQAIACRVMGSYPDAGLGVRAVIFHQRDQKDGPALGALLLAHSGEAMQVETRGARQRVTVFRLKCCFGRGLFLAPASLGLQENDEFILRYPAPTPRQQPAPKL